MVPSLSNEIFVARAVSYTYLSWFEFEILCRYAGAFRSEFEKFSCENL